MSKLFSVLLIVGMIVGVGSGVLGLSGAVHADGDVCVSVNGEKKVDKGDSGCFSEEGNVATAVNVAIAVNDGFSFAGAGDGSVAVAVNGSEAFADIGNDNTAIAVNDSCALAIGGGQTDRAINGTNNC